MCGRYAFFQRPSEVRRQLEQSSMPVDVCPEDDECRQTYNFPPGAIGIVYRANVPDYGAGPSTKHGKQKLNMEPDGDHEELNGVKAEEDPQEPLPSSSQLSKDVQYKLQAMKWGLVPSWTKRAPDYGSVMRTINARDDSCMENKGIWNVPKRRKRCIVIANGFFEWLKKNNGKDKLPHYIKRKDGDLMAFAGMWDVVKYEDSEDKSYTYTIITTEANKQMSFLHDRMPVILDLGSDEIKTWLDPGRYEWNNDLQSLLKPFRGELEIYPVNKDVGKVGNNSPTFIVPLDSAENKHNIANFFGNQRQISKKADIKPSIVKNEGDVHESASKSSDTHEEVRETTQAETTESNAPLPAPSRGIKREHSATPEKQLGTTSSVDQQVKLSPAKFAKKMKSSTSNGSAGKTSSPSKAAQGTPKITKFFGK